MKVLFKFAWIIGLYLILNAFGYFGYGQNIVFDDNSAILEKIEKRYEQMDSIVINNGLAYERDSIVTIINYNYAKEIDSLYEERTHAEQREFLNKTGLEVSLQGYYRTSPSPYLDEEDVNGDYLAKIQAELRWNIMQSSLVKRDANLEYIAAKNKLMKLREADRNKFDAPRYFRDYINATYDALEKNVLIEKIVNYELLVDLEMYLLAQNKVSNEDLYNSFSALSNARRHLAAVSHAADTSTITVGQLFTILSVDTAGLYRLVFETNDAMVEAVMERNVLDAYSKTLGYETAIKAGPYIRASQYFRKNNESSFNVDIGVSLTLPLGGGIKKKQEIAAVDTKMATRRLEYINSDLSSTVKGYVAQLEVYNKALYIEVKRLRMFGNFIRNKSEIYAANQQRYDRIKRLKEYNVYLETVETVIDLARNRDLIVPELIKIAGVEIRSLLKVETVSRM